MSANVTTAVGLVCSVKVAQLRHTRIDSDRSQQQGVSGTLTTEKGGGFVCQSSLLPTHSLSGTSDSPGVRHFSSLS